MPQKLIDGVRVKPLKLIPDERGVLAEVIRADDEIFRKFGQVYFTTAYPGVVKGWHYHKV
jgi:dTDP-4-dehydrorhamnose 3,5-epimerase